MNTRQLRRPQLRPTAGVARAPGGHRKAFLGALALSLVNIAKLALQTLVLPVMARFLGPAAFGLVALAMPFILLANMLCDAGMGQALARERDPSRELESTVFWLAVGIAAALALTIGVGGWFVSPLLHQPALAPILTALAPILILSGSLSVANARILRERNFGVFAVGDLLSAALSAATGIVAALAGCGAWSLVLQQLMLWIVKLLWVMPASGFRPSFQCRPALAKPFLSFGLHSVGANVADFIGKNTATLLVGGMLGVTALGHYAIAYQIVRIPEMVISGPLYLSIFTAVSRAAGDRPAMAEMSMRTLRVLTAALAPMFTGLALIAHPAILLLLGNKWAESAPVLACLTPLGFMLCLYSTIGAIFMGLGRSDRQFILTSILGVGLVGGAIVGAHFSAIGVAIGMGVGVAAAAPFYLRGLSVELDAPVGTILAQLATPVIASLVMACAVLLVRSRMPANPLLLQLVVDIGVGAVTFAAAIALLSGRKLLGDLRIVLPARVEPEA